MLGCLVVWVITVLYSVSAQSTSSCINCFIYPAPFGVNRDYSNDDFLRVGTNISLAWNYQLGTKTHGLWFFQQGDNNGQLIDDSISGQGRIDYEWTIETDKNIDDFPVFFFFVSPNVSSSQSFSSHYVNLTKPLAPSTSSAMPSPTSTSSTSTSSSSSTAASLGSATGTNVPTASNTSQASGGLSSGTSVGLGVGIGVGGLALLAAAALFFLSRRKKQRSATPTDHGPAAAGPAAWSVHNTGHTGAGLGPSPEYTSYTSYHGNYEPKVGPEYTVPVEADGRMTNAKSKDHVELPAS